MTIAFPIEETTRATTAPAATDNPPRITDTPIRKLPLSEKRLAANRANAQKSTGPRTTQGKATVSQNATAHGLTSTTPPPLADTTYSTRLYELKEEHRPTTPSQHYLVEQLAHIGWKLEQIPQIEAHLLAHLKQSATTTDPNSEFSIQNSSFPTLFAKDLLTEKPTPLTRLWDLHRRLLSQFQSILRQIPRLRKQAQNLEDQDEEKSKFESNLARGERLDRFLADLPAHNARCDAAHRARYNLSPDHPRFKHPAAPANTDPAPIAQPARQSLAVSRIPNASPAQIKPTTPSEISNPQISNPPPAQIKPTAPPSLRTMKEANHDTHNQLGYNQTQPELS